MLAKIIVNSRDHRGFLKILHQYHLEMDALQLGICLKPKHFRSSPNEQPTSMNSWLIKHQLYKQLKTAY